MADNIFVTELYPYIDKALSNKSNIDKFNTIVAKYVDRNANVLTDIGPFDVAYFTEKDSSDVFDLIGISPNEVKGIQKKTKLPNAGAHMKNVMSNPFNILMTMIIRYAYINKDEKLKYTSVLYFSLSMYQYFFKQKYFRYAPNRNIMEYTINNLSMKYMIKQSTNLMDAWYKTANGVATLMEKEIESKNMTDANVYLFIQYVFTRLNAFMKNIYDAFITNHAKGNYINLEAESSDRENFREAKSTVHIINQMTEKIIMKLLIEGPPVQLITKAAKFNKVSINELRNYINKIVVEENKDDIKSMVESILFMYIFDEGNDPENINSNQFPYFCMEIYKRAISTKNAVNVKNILDKWITDLGTYKKTQRAATINNFKRAIYTFFVFAIMHYNN